MAKQKIQMPLGTPNKREVKREKPKGEETENLWRRRVSSALNWRRQHWNGDKNWELAYKIYRGKHWEQNDQETDILSSDNPNDRITVNVTGSTILNLVPFLYNRNITFIVKGRRPDTAVQASIQQELLNYAFENSDMQAEIKKALLDHIIIGHGIMKTGYTIEIDEARLKDQGDIVYEDFIKKDSPYVKRVSPYMFLFDPTSTTFDLRGARWCAEIFFNTYEDVISNSKYDAKVIKSIVDGEYQLSTYNEVFPEDINADTGGLSNYLKANDGSYDIPEDKLVVLYEIWDKKHKQVLVFADGCPQPLLQKPWPFEYLSEFPFVRLEFIPVPDQHYPLGLPYFVKDQQFELNRIRSSMFRHRRVFNRKYQVLDTVDNEESAKLVDSPDGTVIKVPAINAISPIQDATVGQDQMITEQYVKQDIQELTGSDALFRGGALPSRTTAGEVSARTSLFRMKLDDRVDAVDKAILAVGKQVLKHIQGNFLINRAVQIMGEQGRYWVEATSEDINAEVDVTMESVAAPKTDPVLEKQQALQLLQIALQFFPMIQQGLVKLDLNELLKYVLEKFGNKDLGRFFPAMLIANAPLQQNPVSPTGEVSNNLNANPAGLPAPGQETQDLNSLQRETGIAPIQNSGGLQL